MQQINPPAAAGLHISQGFLDQLLSDLLLSHWFVVQKFLELFNVLMAVKSQTMASSAISSRSSRFLVIALQTLGNVVVDDEPDIGLIDPHAKGNGGDHHIHLFHEERVLMTGACGRIQTRVVGKGFDPIHLQGFLPSLPLSFC